MPDTDDTIYRIASMTKPITSVAVMMLVEEGKLRLEDPLEKFVPEFTKVRVMSSTAANGKSAPEQFEAAKRPITIRHLLTHTSGMTYGFFGREPVAEQYRQAEVADGLSETPGTIGDNIKRLTRVPLLFHPGEKWEYGLNTDVLGRVIEVVSGQTLDQFFAERIFRPLSMNDTAFSVGSRQASAVSAAL